MAAAAFKPPCRRHSNCPLPTRPAGAARPRPSVGCAERCRLSIGETSFPSRPRSLIGAASWGSRHAGCRPGAPSASRCRHGAAAAPPAAPAGVPGLAARAGESWARRGSAAWGRRGGACRREAPGDPFRWCGATWDFGPFPGSPVCIRCFADRPPSWKLACWAAAVRSERASPQWSRREGASNSCVRRYGGTRLRYGMPVLLLY